MIGGVRVANSGKAWERVLEGRLVRAVLAVVAVMMLALGAAPGLAGASEIDDGGEVELRIVARRVSFPPSG